jgi:hypothetical protein
MAEEKQSVPVVNRIYMVRVDIIERADWNPSQNNPTSLQNLMENIKQVGFSQNLNVVPLQNFTPGKADANGLLTIDSGKFRVIDGHDRLEAARTLGMTHVPCVINTEWAEEAQKLQAVRFNVIHKELDPMKFLSLFNEVAKRYGKEATEAMMMFSNKAALEDLKKGIREALPPTMRKAVEKKTDSAKTLQDLSSIVAEMFNKVGTNLDQGFMVFSYGGTEHVYVQMNKQLRDEVKKLVTKSEVERRHISDVFSEALGLPVAAKEAAK